MEKSDVLVIGAGVAGLSTAVQLAARGIQVSVIDRGALGSGATSKASGLLGQLRGSVAASHMMQESLATLLALEAETGRKVFRQSGSLRVAQNEARGEELEQSLQMAELAGIPAERISIAEASDRVPLMRSEDLVAAAYFPSDGYVSPPDVALLYVAAGETRGVRFFPGRPVDSLVFEGGRLIGCRSGDQEWRAPVVVNAAGPWAHQIAGMGGDPLPCAGVGHCYLTVWPEPRIDPNTASLRDRENRLYARPTREGAMHIGIYEPRPVLFDLPALADRFQMAELGIERFTESIELLMELAHRRFPILSSGAPITYTAGVMAWSPDGHPLCGPSEHVSGLYHCAGFCGHGVMTSAAVGLLMADLICDGKWRHDPTELTVGRFRDRDDVYDRTFVEHACLHAYATCYGAVSEDHPGR